MLCCAVLHKAQGRAAHAAHPPTRACPPPPPQGVDLGALLLSVHDFFLFLGVDEIRRRSSSDDKPLRMVKTILHELCKLKVRGRGRWMR